MIENWLKKAEVKEKELSDKLLERATSVYRKQKGALLDIKNTEGMTEIIRWFRAEKSSLEKDFAEYRGNLRKEGEYSKVCEFLRFLENMFSESEAQTLDEAVRELDRI